MKKLVLFLALGFSLTTYCENYVQVSVLNLSYEFQTVCFKNQKNGSFSCKTVPKRTFSTIVVQKDEPLIRKGGLTLIPHGSKWTPNVTIVISKTGEQSILKENANGPTVKASIKEMESEVL